MNITMKIAIAGLGTVGAGLIKLLADNAAEISVRANEEIEVLAVNARDKNKDRGVDISGLAWVDNPVDLAGTDADIILELIGGEEGVALELTKAALANGKHVVTANKAMLAYHGGELAELAEKNNVTLAYEAAVAGGIPVIKTLREGLAGNKIKTIIGILNGTCNYILTEMLERKMDYADILDEAQEKGYAEADPELDVGGGDAAHKLAILAANAFGKKPNFADLYVEGIQNITVGDLEFANKLGYAIKHLCFAQEVEGKVEQRAHPCLIPSNYQLANVNDVFNAVEIDADPVGRVALTGRGAGAGPTASAVLADVIDIANGRLTNTFTAPIAELGEMEVLPIEEIESSYYLRLQVEDEAGVLEEVTSILGDEDISILKMIQDEPKDHDAQIVIITHDVKERKMQNAVAKLNDLASVEKPAQLIRILK